MRKIILVSLCFLFLSASIAGAEGDVAVFDLQRVAGECDALKAAKGALDAKFGAQRNDLDKERTALEKKNAEYQKKAPTEKQRQAFMKDQKAYSEKAQAFMRLLQADEMRIRTDIDTLIGRAAKELASRNGYLIMLDVAAAPYVDPKLDVTAEMLAETNVQWRKEVDGAPAATQPAPAPAPASGPASGK